MMRKILSILLLLSLVTALALPGGAVDGGLSVTHMEVEPGDTAYLRVSLNESVKGNSIRVTYSYDSSQLQALPKACTWEKKGLLQDFDYRKNGVWASSDVTELKGDLFVLAFAVRKSAKFADTMINCEVIVKNGTEVVGSYSAIGVVSMYCEHEFGSWEDSGNVGHAQQCKHCGKTLTASHSWDDGVISDIPDEDRVKLKTYTCTACGRQRTQKVAVDTEEPTVDVPQPPQETTEPVTYPTAPPQETTPRHEETVPTYPETGEEMGGGHQEDRPNQSPEDDNYYTTPQASGEGNGQTQDGQDDPGSTEPPADDHAGHDHSNPGNTSGSEAGNQPSTNSGQQGSVGHDHDGDTPGTIPEEILNILESQHDHDHDHEQEPVNPGVVVFMVILAGAMIALPIYLIKNKKRI